MTETSEEKFTVKFPQWKTEATIYHCDALAMATVVEKQPFRKFTFHTVLLLFFFLHFFNAMH